MKCIKLDKHNEDDWGMRFVDETDYDLLLNESVRVEKPDGSPLLVLLKSALSKEAIDCAWPILRPLKLTSRNRGMAAGRAGQALEGLTKDGKARTGKTLQSAPGWHVYSGIIGYFERTVRFPYCRACAWNLEHPEKFARLLPEVREVDALFRRRVPDRYAAQKEFVDRTSPDFVIPGTVFTTLTINKNFRTACHKDAGDLESGFSCMSVIREGEYKGGNLVLPAWRIAANLETGDVVLFDAHQFHGNTQIVPVSKGAQRCSIVHYYRENIVKCRSQAEELRRVKSRKPGDPIWES